MRRNMRWLGSLLLAALLAALPARQCLAGDGDYTYKVTVYPGAQGSFTENASPVVGEENKLSGDAVTVEGIEYGTDIKFQDSLEEFVSLPSDSPYYAKGIRQAGKDTGTGSVLTSFTVEKDTDFVVAYGIKANSVKYTVRYLLEETGEPLMEERTGRGDVGDIIYVGYEPYTGYLPRELNITKSDGLSANEAENIFTFHYYPAGSITITDTELTTIYNALPGETTTTTVTQGGAGGTGGGGGGGGAQTVTDDGTPAANVDLDGDGAADAVDLVDIGEDESPLADVGLDEDLSESGALRNLLPIYISIILLALAGFFGGFIFLKKSKKKEEDEED